MKLRGLYRKKERINSERDSQYGRKEAIIQKKSEGELNRFFKKATKVQWEQKVNLLFLKCLRKYPMKKVPSMRIIDRRAKVERRDPHRVHVKYNLERKGRLSEGKARKILRRQSTN